MSCTSVTSGRATSSRVRALTITTRMMSIRSTQAFGACEEICPEVFRVDENLGYAQLLDLETYPEDKINEAIIACPGRCIDWNESKDAENPPVSPFSKGGRGGIFR